jgi:N-ethylmaleimide reductase
VTEGVVNAWSADRVGVRLSPTNPFNDMRDSDPVETFTYAAEALNAFQLAYLHVLEALPGHLLAAAGEPSVHPHMRQVFQGPMLINGGYDAEKGADAIAANQADAVAYGVPFIANPDLPERFAHNAELNEADPATFYTSGPEGYIDYPTLTQLTADA